MKKDFNPIGSKERFVEMFQKVNKIKLNEESQNPDFFAATGLIKLLNKELKVNKTNIQSNDNESFVELNCFDENNKPINFKFKVTGTEGDQEGVYNITDATLIEFSTDEMTLPEANLTRLNQNMKNQILDVVSEFVDFEEDIPEISEERYMDAIKKIDSYPFGGTPRDDMQTMKAYADEKPNNSNIRVKAPELDKYVDETINLDPIAQQQYNASSSPERKKEIILKAAQKAADFLNQLGMTVDHLTHEGYIILIKRMINDVHLQKTVGLNENEEENDDVEIEEPEQDTGDNLDVDTEIDVDQVISDKEKAGDLIAGGLGDDKSPSEFNKEQLMLGMEVEMEHTDNPMIALEITIDHLTENPEYYTTKDDPDMAAQANAAVDAEDEPPATDDPAVVSQNKHPLADILHSDGTEEYEEPTGRKGVNRALEDDDEELTDTLLGYEQKNEVISEAQIKMAKQALNKRGVGDKMTKKEAVEILIRHYIK